MNADTGLLSEVSVLAFLALAWSGIFVTNRRAALLPGSLVRDPELRMAAAVLTASLALLALFNLDLSAPGRVFDSWAEALAAIWSGLYASASFLATAGFQSGLSEAGLVPDWFRIPSLMLNALAVCGGGVATTAGGIKLLRVLALAKQGDKELSRLVYPSVVVPAGMGGVSLRLGGQSLAWLSVTAFFASAALFLLGLTAVGLPFQTAAAVSFAGLSTTGPLAPAVLGNGFAYQDLNAAAKCLFAAAMILGRLEFLSFAALFNPALWRR